MIIRLPMARVTSEQLNDQCLHIIALFSIQLRQHNGTIINTEDECIVKQMMLHSKISQCSELEELYEEFKYALMEHIESPEFDLSQILNDEVLIAAQNQPDNSSLLF
ncbi:MAG: hypothetical protein KTR16_15115 [Acidiferrobacterales bacterium]|nr:hypothetical protein [Acidiferrobacterales bacterium]